jgi:hypothetical protein
MQEKEEKRANNPEFSHSKTHTNNIDTQFAEDREREGNRTSLSPSPVIARTSLITLIFALASTSVSFKSNMSFTFTSSATAAGPAPSAPTAPPPAVKSINDAGTPIRFLA